MAFVRDGECFDLRMRQPRIAPILAMLPDGIQLEILSRREFSDFLEKRCRNVASSSFDRRMRQLARSRRLRPLLRFQQQPYYSPLQIFTYHHGDTIPPERLAEFDRLIAFIHRVQDFYVPEVRSNGRVATFMRSRGLLNRSEGWSIAAIRDWRVRKIAAGELNLPDLLSEYALSIEGLRWWRLEFASTVAGLDPLRDWQNLVERISYDKRQRLRYEALLAQDYREIGNIVVLLLRDLGALKQHDELMDIFDGSGRDEESGSPVWRLEKFGREHLDDHFFQLELISNEYDINPKPRGIIFTEGDEWQALELLFRARGFDPTVLGIEFRSLFGIGNFDFNQWSGFVEYMHEKQILVFFVIDSERRDLAQQLSKFTTKKRRNPIEGLVKVMPEKDRIRKWEKSFEESNFTDEEIAAALRTLGKDITSDDVARARKRHSDLGLVKALSKSCGEVRKPTLDRALVDLLIGTMDSRTDRRPVEEFVDDAGNLITLNHQPSHLQSITYNRNSGYLG